MRKDFHKVITERHRVGGTWHDTYFDRNTNFKYRDREMVEDFDYIEDDFRPPKESMTKRHRVLYQGKEFSDLINPLRRFLYKQVGRPWNDVWSEICKVLKGNGVLQQHVKQHVRSEIYGISFSGDKYFRGEMGQPDGYPYRDCLYVNDSGILCLKRGRSLKKARRKARQQN